ncbi:MAG: hypothetical protein CW691_11840 [Candidatus Bathyarchaeum sp.]|nr:MAG: hypothetical protein CW691_11840 [Candidatus Bathyarchaeum sp.]
MKFNLNKITVSLSRTFLITLLVFGLTQVAVTQVFAQAPGLIIFINSDTTWTKADSPRTLTGPVFVSNGATLTIESGVSVDCNGYYLLVNGTLRVIGSAQEKIRISKIERFEFTEFSEGWNEQTGSGSILENAIIGCGLTAGSIPLRVIGCVFDGDVTVGGSSVISGCSLGDLKCEGSLCVLDSIINGGVNAENSVISNNIIEEHVYSGNNSVVSYNTIGGIVHGREILNNNITGTYQIIEGHVNVVSGTIVSNNTIVGRVTVRGEAIVSNNWIQGNYTMIIKDLVGYMGMRSSVAVYYGAINVQGGSPLICNNFVDGGITTSIDESSPIIINNTVINSGIFIPCPMSDTEYIYSRVPSVGDGGSPEICHNTVDGIIKVDADSCKISGNTATEISIVEGQAHIYDNAVNDGEGIRVFKGDVIIEGNYLYNNTFGIRGSGEIKNNTIIGSRLGLSTGGSSIVRNNTVIDCDTGVKIIGDELVTFERNRLYNDTVGITVSSKANITNNTISDTEVAVILYNYASVTISYNNIVNYSNHSISLGGTSGSNLDVAYNWWGTVDAQAINISMRDYKYDFNLGKVSFTPFLTEPNPQATSDTVPEFPSWIILPLFLVATVAVVSVRKKSMWRNRA